MARKKKNINNLGYKGDEDSQLIDMAKEYTKLHPGLTVKAAIRNYLLTRLPSEIERLRKNGNGLARQV